jgi:hypothetical protein
MDRIGLDGADALAAIIARHSQVERVIAGHLHWPITVRFAGTVASTCPSPLHQLAGLVYQHLVRALCNRDPTAAEARNLI